MRGGQCGFVARAFLASSALTLLVMTASTGRAPADDSSPCNNFAGLTCPSQGEDGWVYAYDVLTDTTVQVPKSQVGTPDPKMTYEYALSPACMQADPFDSLLCSGATEYCAANGGSGLHENVWRSDSTTAFSNWSIVGDLCTGELPAPVSAQQVIDAVQEYERDHMPIAVPLMQPSNMALVNMPLLVSVTPFPVETMAVALPVPGELVARPSYAWSFDGGPSVSGAGVPFDGTDPRVDPAHYVSHTYVKAQAQASVSLTVTWTATFTAAGETVTVPDVVMPAVTMTYSVHEARSVLVSG